jgi:hypothetical protein
MDIDKTYQVKNISAKNARAEECPANAKELWNDSIPLINTLHSREDSVKHVYDLGNPKVCIREPALVMTIANQLE